MGYLFLGIALLLIAFLVPLPYIVYIILLIAGVLALIAGLWFLFQGLSTAPPAGGRRYRRW